MMNYATQYPTNHYPPSQGPGSAPLPPEGAHLHQQHQGAQQSPVLPSQDQRYQQSPNQPPPHAPMYNPAYGMQQQFMTPGQAAAMATAAAAGTAGAYYEQRNPRTPPGGPNPMAPSLPSQQQQQQHLQQHPPRRMSNHTGGPHAPNMPNNHAPPPSSAGRQSGPPPNAMPPPPMQPGGAPTAAPPVQNPSPDPPPPGPGQAEESPLYVNAKQFHRILKRRVARQRLEEALRLTSKGRRPYLHESRHRHAMRRPRGPGGRFLTADEVAKMENGELQLPIEGEDKENAGATNAKKGRDKKRKSQGGGEPPSKKRRSSSAEAEEEEEDDEDDGDGEE